MPKLVNLPGRSSKHLNRPRSFIITYCFVFLVMALTYIITYNSGANAKKNLVKAELVLQNEARLQDVNRLFTQVNHDVFQNFGLKDSARLINLYTSKSRIDSLLATMKSDYSTCLNCLGTLDSLKVLNQKLYSGVMNVTTVNTRLPNSINTFFGALYQTEASSEKIEVAIATLSSDNMNVVQFALQRLSKEITSSKQILAISDILAFLLIVFGFLNYYRENKVRRNADKKIEMFQKTLLQSQLEIQEQTFQEISQEIHDNIGQVLSLVKINLMTIETNASLLTAKVDDTKALVGKAIRDLRSLSHRINTDIITEMGLARALQNEMEQIQKLGIIHTTFEIHGAIVKLKNDTELILFRIVQEALNNVLKHADALELTLELEYNSYVSVIIRDNGKGFDIKALNTDSRGFSLGINNIKKRIALLNGRLELTSYPGSGTTLSIVVPV